MIPRIILLFLCSFFIVESIAQEPDRPEIDLEDFIEELYQVQDENIEYDDLYESLLLLYTNPLDINRATKDELLSIYFLSIEQVNELLFYRQKNGDFISLYELQAVPRFDLDVIRRILPFIEISVGDQFATSGPLWHRIVNEENNYFLLRTERILQEQRGFSPASDRDENRYKGDAWKLYGRFRTSHSNDFSLGFTFEKDAGEQLRWDPGNKQYGFDYFSGHFMKENVGNFRKIILGDYQMQFGQGLLFGAGFNPGKGAETITTVRRTSSGISPYTSVLESGFLRGAAMTYQLKNLSITPFFSRLSQDASIGNDSTFTNFDEYISSIQQSGLHRTDSELANRDLITEMVYGANVELDLDQNDLQLGFTYLNVNYSLPLFKRPNNYNQFEFRGTNNYNLGAYFNYNWENFLVFGEGAVSKSGGLGMVGGIIGSLSPIVSISMVLRNYQRDFHSFYGNAFAESSRNINERGIYWGLKITPSRKYFFSAYYDRFKYPWLRFRAESPSQGYEYLIRFNYKPKRTVHLHGQYRAESEALTVNVDEGNLNRLEQGLKKSYLFNLSYNVTSNLSIKSRFQMSDYTLAGIRTNGIAIAQDVNFEFSKFKVSTRWALIDTEDFENRQYMFERDVLYSFSVRGISGEAIRSYILLQYKPSKRLNFWLRYAQTSYQDSQRILSSEDSSIGSGLSQINGNTRSEIKAQIRYKF